MQHLLTPYNDIFHPFVYWENGFTEQELNWLQEKAKNADMQASVGNNPPLDELKKIRRSKIFWLDNNDLNNWVFLKLSHIISSLNSQFYRFDLTGFAESLQLTNYDSADNGTYGWHQDLVVGNQPNRKMSLVLQLSDPSEYEGGNLQILNGIDPINIKKQRGLISLFPSYQLHRVTPVVSGTRQSLVSWVTGPAFK